MVEDASDSELDEKESSWCSWWKYFSK